MPQNKKKSEFKVIFNYSNAPDAQERVFAALDMLISEQDILEWMKKQKKRQGKKIIN